MTIITMNVNFHAHLLARKYIEREVTSLRAILALPQSCSGHVVSGLLKVKLGFDEVRLHLVLRVEYKEVVTIGWHSANKFYDINSVYIDRA